MVQTTFFFRLPQTSTESRAFWRVSKLSLQQVNIKDKPNLKSPMVTIPLDSCGIVRTVSVISAVDYTAAGMEAERRLLRSLARPRPGHRAALPPQIFNDDLYCGDYEDFDTANEYGKLETFLKIHRPRATEAEHVDCARLAVHQQVFVECRPV